MKTATGLDPDRVGELAEVVRGTTMSTAQLVDRFDDLDGVDECDLEADLDVVGRVLVCPRCGWWWGAIECVGDDGECSDCVAES